MEKKKLKNLIIFMFWIGVWQLFAISIQNALLLPTPYRVALRISELLVQNEFWRITFVSIGRIMFGTLAAIILGVFLGIITSMNQFLATLIRPLISTVQATPVASITILVLVWMKRDFVPALICGMMVFPVIWTNVCAGIQSVDTKLLEMAKVYRLSKKQIVKRIYVPTVLPYFQAACSTSLGLGWKSGIAAEVLTVPANSIGRMISESKIYLMTEDLFAWTFIVVMLSMLVQHLVMKLLRRRNTHA